MVTRPNWRLGLCALLASSCAAPLFAQVRPDAGRVLEDSRQGGPLPPSRPGTPVELREPDRPAFSAPSSFKVLVKSFRITRASVFAEEELKSQIASFVGRELTLADLERAADLISRYYRERGYFVARAYLPAQDIKDGVVEITVLEGRVGSMRIEQAPGMRLSESVVRDTVATNQPEGSVIEQRRLERGLLLLNDLPGITVQSSLSPGAQLGDSDLRVAVSEGSLVSGALDADNYGNRFIGVLRVGVSGYLNNPSGRGDLASLRFNHASGLDSLRLGYALPLGADGLKLFIGAASVRYKLCCDFASLQARGTAQEINAGVQYPFVRTRNFNLYGGATATAKALFNETIAGTTSDKTARALALALSADGRDDWGGGGYSAGSLAFTGGRLNLDGWAPDRAADVASARAHGGYGKLTYGLNRLQRLGASTALYVSLAGQAASKNLDSSEQFSLGGPQGVRAYPTGEATGDEGVLASAELRWDFAAGWQFAGFVDHGAIRLHRNEWAGWQGANARLQNRYDLAAAGLGLTWSRVGDFAVRAVWAHKLGSNPGRSATDRDSDNRSDRNRLWLQLVKTL